MLPDRVSNPGPLTYESGALPIALRGPAVLCLYCFVFAKENNSGVFQFASLDDEPLPTKAFSKRKKFAPVRKWLLNLMVK